jgi:hypothetical protein
VPGDPHILIPIYLSGHFRLLEPSQYRYLRQNQLLDGDMDDSANFHATQVSLVDRLLCVP